jgi:hypothetical protein
MKKIIVIFLLSACSIAYAVDFKKMIIGKWNMTIMNGKADEKFSQAIFDGETMVLTFDDSEMKSQPYTIKGNKFCTIDQEKMKCQKLVYVSNNEFYMPDDKIKLTRVVE